MNILVTAGPNREYIDAIRFITSASSGRMGYAIASAAKKVGHNVTLISGPTSLEPPHEVNFIAVVSAREMRDAVMSEFPTTDCVIMSAAVSDYRPAEIIEKGSTNPPRRVTPSSLKKIKLKKGTEELTLKLVRNPDILFELGQKKRDNQILVGFSLEVQNPLENALKKLRDKNLDYIVLNDQTSLGALRATVKIIDKSNSITEIENASKNAIARRIVEIIAQHDLHSPTNPTAEKSMGFRSQDADAMHDSSSYTSSTIDRSSSDTKHLLKVKLKIKQKDSCKDLPVPKYMSAGASGMDLYAAVEEATLLKPGEIKLIPTGIHISLPKGYEAQIRPRSGLALKHGITILNAPGTIDSDYRNEIGVILTNLGSEPFKIERGMRIAQLVIAHVVLAEVSQVEELDTTERNLKGFGSTGLKMVNG